MGVVKVALSSKMSVLVELILVVNTVPVSSFTTMFAAFFGKSKTKADTDKAEDREAQEVSKTQREPRFRQQPATDGRGYSEKRPTTESHGPS